MAAVWALPNAPLRSAVTNKQAFSTADQVAALISHMVPFGTQPKQGLSASLPIFLSTVIIMAPVPEYVMQEVNKEMVPPNERMEYTPDGRPCVHFPAMIHRIGIPSRTLVSTPIPRSRLIQPNQAITSSSLVPSSSHTPRPLSSSTLPATLIQPSRLLEALQAAESSTHRLNSPPGIPWSATMTPCSRLSKIKSSAIVQTGALASQTVGTSQPTERLITPISTPTPKANPFLRPPTNSLLLPTNSLPLSLNPPQFRPPSDKLLRTPINCNTLRKRRLVSRIYLHLQFFLLRSRRMLKTREGIDPTSARKRKKSWVEVLNFVSCDFVLVIRNEPPLSLHCNWVHSAYLFVDLVAVL